ncbi:MAG TPA: hypothetical protein VH761_11565 [Ilumatobacteraceae bacterium]
MEPDKVPDSERHVIAVLRSREAADRVVDRLVASGVNRQLITVDDPADETPALRAEMRAELSDAVILPQASFIADKEGARGFGLTLLLTGLIALVLAFPIALIDYGLSYWSRFLVAAGITVGLALMIALVFGIAWGSSDPNKPAAAQRGTTLRVRVDNESVKRIIVEADPIRVDEITEQGEPAAAVHTENQAADDNLADKAIDTVAHMKEQSDKPQ